MYNPINHEYDMYKGILNEVKDWIRQATEVELINWINSHPKEAVRNHRQILVDRVKAGEQNEYTTERE